jgi:hypothetical protein
MVDFMATFKRDVLGMPSSGGDWSTPGETENKISVRVLLPDWFDWHQIVK